MSKLNSHAFESSITANCKADATGVIARVNRTFCRLWGFESAALVIGRNLASLFTEEETVARVLKTLRPGGEWTGNIAVSRDDTTTFLARIYVCAVEDDDGALAGFEAVCVDISAEQRSRDALMDAQRFRDRIIEASLNGIYIFDVVTRSIVYLNSRYTALTGYTLESLNAMSPDQFFELFHPDDQERVVAHMEAVARATDDEILGLEYRVRTADGRWIHCLSWDGVFERDEQGEVRQQIGTFLDITERWKSEEQARYHAGLLAGISDAVLSTDIDFNIRVWNKPAEKLYGWTAEEVIGKPFPEIVNPVYAGATRDVAVADFFARGSWRGEAIHRRKDGEQINVLTSVALVHGPDGEPSGIVAVNRDVTERKRLETRAVQADRLASVGLLAAGVAHEINNPLTFVLYNIDSLAETLPKLVDTIGRLQTGIDAQTLKAILGSRLKSISPSRLDDIVSQVEDAAEGALRVRQIVKDLRTFSRSDEERQGPVFVNEVLERAINLVYSEIRSRAKLVKEYGILPAVVANDGRLAQVFLNLLLNAAQAIEEGDASRNEIRVRTTAEGDSVVVEVRDTGSGISEEDLPHLFLPFFSTKDVGVGSGLGLAICQSIVEGYHGDIAIETSPGKGSSFIVRLPIGTSATTSWEESSPNLTPPVLSGRFLIVDDEQHIVAAMRRMLAVDHRVVTATSGVEAKEILKTDRGFHGIICDLIMPHMTGIELYDWVRREFPDLAERMVFMSGGAFTPAVKKFLARVDNKRFEKPFEPKELKQYLQEVVARGAPFGAERA